MKATVIGALSIIASFGFIIKCYAGLASLFPGVIVKGIVIFVMMIALAVSINNILTTIVDAYVVSNNPGEYIKDRKLGMIGCLVLIAVIVLTGTLVPLILG